MTVEERIAALEAQIAELREELAKRNVRHSMARTRTCPACGGGAIYMVSRVRANGPLGLVDFSLNPQLSTWRGYLPGDALHAYVCKACRLVEWQTVTTDHLVRDDVDVVELTRPNDDAPPSDDPYR